MGETTTRFASSIEPRRSGRNIGGRASLEPACARASRVSMRVHETGVAQLQIFVADASGCR